jgi:single-strand DNA-binding protein
MTRGLNKVTIIGNVGREPEMRYTPNGRPVASFNVAVSRSWQNPDGGHREEIEWFNIVAWGDIAEWCKARLHRNHTVYIEGRLQTRGWEDADGTRHVRTEIVANDVIPFDAQDTPAVDYDGGYERDEDDYAF